MFESTKARLLALAAGPAAIAAIVGGSLLVSATSASAQTPPAATPSTQSQAAPDTQAEAPETAAEASTTEPTGPGGVEVGHQDAPGVDVQHDFQGQE